MARDGRARARARPGGRTAKLTVRDTGVREGAPTKDARVTLGPTLVKRVRRVRHDENTKTEGRVRAA